MTRILLACLGVLFLASNATAQLFPFAIDVDPAGNAVLEAGETAVIQPTWTNPGGFSFTGCPSSLSNFTGPTATYTLVDGNGCYGFFAPFSGPQTCGDCYAVRVTAPSRPATHWDASATEAVAIWTKVWTLHVGATFDDVTTASPFYRFVETILHHGITSGCSATAYCPLAPATRQQMAVFVLVAKEGPSYSPPACAAPMFGDVPASSPFCRWIEELARRGVVAGCGAGTYCPTAAVPREQMAVFVLRTLDPALTPPACTTPVFADVPASSPFCSWIEELARRGIVTGCGGGNYCPAAAVTREQMSVFLAAAFGLQLYGL